MVFLLPSDGKRSIRVLASALGVKRATCARLMVSPPLRTMNLHTIRDYKIRDGSVDKAYIGGHPAIRAIGDFELGDKKFSEALAWIITEHTRTYFMVRGAVEDLPSLRASLDQVLQSAKIP